MIKKSNINLLLNCIKNNKSIFLLSVFLSFLVSLSSFIVPFFMKFFTDEVIIAKDVSKVSFILISFISLALISYFVNLLHDYTISKMINYKFSFNIRKRLSNILLYIDSKYLYKETLKVAEKDIESKILGDVESFKMISFQSIRLITELIRLILLIAVIFYYSWIIGLIVLIRIPLYFLIGKLYDPKLLKKNELQRSHYSILIEKIKSVFISQPYIKTMFLEKKINKDLDCDLDKYCSIQHNLSLLNSKISRIMLLINFSFSLCILFLGGMFVLKGIMTIGTLMLVSNIQSRSMMPLNFFSNFYLQYRSSFPSLNRLVTFLETKTEYPYLHKNLSKFESENEMIFKDITLRNICFNYDDVTPALKNVTFKIGYGDKIVIIGDNMSGKSTLLSILAGIIKPDSGSIKVDNEEFDKFMLRKLSTLHFQNLEVYKINDVTGSGGERQLHKIQIMDRIKSPLLLFDEPDANLNEIKLKIIYKLFEKSETIIMVSHRNLENKLRHIENLRILKFSNGSLIKEDNL